MKSYADRFEQALKEQNLSPDDLKNGKRGIGSYFRKLRDGRLTDKDVLTQTLANSLDSPEQWTSKTSGRKEEIMALAQNTLMPLLREAERPARNMLRPSTAAVSLAALQQTPAFKPHR